MSFTFVNAGAGCGKTTWIIEQIVKFIENQENNNIINKTNKILIITYTNSCVEELKKRLEIKKENFQKWVDIFTFHSMCYKYGKLDGVFSENTNLELLLSYANESYENSFEEFYNYYLCHRPILKENYLENLDIYYKNAKRINNISKFDLNDFITLDGNFRKIKPNYINDENQWEKDKEDLNGHLEFLTKEYNLIYFKRCLLVEEIRKHLKIYTYQHIILNILDNLNEFINFIYDKYKEIFIDEVQDLSHIQFKIIKSLSEELPYNLHHHVTIVGDINQSIYSFQGANKDNFYNFLNAIKCIPSLEYKEISLNKTHRFGGEILNFINEEFYHHRSDLINGKIYLYPLCKNIESLISIIENTIKNTNGSILILFQRRSSLTVKLEDKLNSVKMSHKISYQDEMLNTFFSLISYILMENENHLINFLLGVMFFIPEPELYNFIQKYRNNIFQGLEYEYGTSKEFILLKQLKSVNNSRDFLSLFYDSIFHQRAYGAYGNNINIFLEELKKIDNICPISLNNLLFLENKDLWFEKEGIIHLSTIHNSKGMEADEVFIIDANLEAKSQSIILFNNCPFYNFFHSKQKTDEFNNLLYVATTRAKKNLHIFGHGIKINENSLYDICNKWKKKVNYNIA